MRQSQELTIMDYFTLQDNLQTVGSVMLPQQNENPTIEIPGCVTLFEFRNQYFVEVRGASGVFAGAWVNRDAMQESVARQWFADLCSGAKSWDQYAAAVPGYD